MARRLPRGYTRESHAAMLESVRLHNLIDKATTEEEFQALLAQHDAIADAHPKTQSRIKYRTLAEFKTPKFGAPGFMSQLPKRPGW